MKKTLLILALLANISAFAQEVYTSSGKPVNARKQQQKEKGFDRDKLIFGGWFGAQFGTVTSLNISPIIGYKLSDKFSAGVGVGYRYDKYKNYYGQGLNLTYHAMQLSAWARYLITDEIFAHVEPQHFQYTVTEPTKETISVPVLLVGAGYKTPMSARSSFVIMLLYDVLQDQNSPYGTNITPMMGFNVGF
jgi:hypothetical protein